MRGHEPWRWSQPLQAIALWLALCGPGLAQNQPDLEWREVEVPPPATVARDGHIPVAMPAYVALQYGIDPASLRIDADGVVRYVVVASNSSGARNVFYEGVRCKTAEFKTYARMHAEGQWTAVQKASWKSIYETTVSRHVRELVRQGLCKGPLPGASTAPELVRLLKYPEQRPS